MSGLVLPPPPLMPAQAPVERAALFLDFDGTLVDIAPRPDAVRVPEELSGVLLAMSRALDGALAIVSGRRLVELQGYLPAELLKVGEHGAAMQLSDDAVPLPRAPAEWRARARAFALSVPGILLEEKQHGFVLHYRQVPAAGRATEVMLRSLLAGSHSFQLLPAHMAWEVKPNGVSKGGALRRLMQRKPFASRIPVFIGDDVTDEEGMSVARDLGGQGWRLQDAFGSPVALHRWLSTALESA